MKRLSFILLALIAFGPMAWAQQTTYELVTSGQIDWSGNYLMGTTLENSSIGEEVSLAFSGGFLSEIPGALSNNMGIHFGEAALGLQCVEDGDHVYLIDELGEASVLMVAKSSYDPLHYSIRLGGGTNSLKYLYVGDHGLEVSATEPVNHYWNFTYTPMGVKMYDPNIGDDYNLYYLLCFTHFGDISEQFDVVFYMDWNHSALSLGCTFQDHDDGHGTSYTYYYRYAFLFKDPNSGNASNEPLGEVALPYSFGFEDAGEMVNFWWKEYVQFEWSQGYLDGGFVGQSTEYPRNGRYGLKFNYVLDDPGASYLISPKLTGDHTNGVHVEFYYSSYLEEIDEYFQVGYSTTGTNTGDTGTNTGDFIYPGGTYHTNSPFYQRFSADFPPETKYVAIRCLYNPQQYALYIDDILFKETSSCPEPHILEANGVTSTSATINWDAGGSETQWDLYYSSIASDVPDENTTPSHLSLTTTSCDLTGLTSGTTYYVYVRGLCSETETSDWSMPYTFNTDCAAIALPYSCNFSNLSLPLCWNYLEPSTSTFYVVPDDNRVDGSCLMFALFDATEYLMAVLPEVDANYPLNRFQVSFKAAHNGLNTTTQGHLSIGVMTDPNDISTFDSQGDVTITNHYVDDDPTHNYQSFTVSLSNYTGNGRYIAIKNTGNVGFVFFDDLEVTTSYCLEPVNVMASNETITSATISWTVLGSENEWDIYYTSNSSDVPTASTNPSISGLSTNTLNLTGLTPATTYYVYVRAACSETDKSDWSTPCTFNTECQSMTLPYSYGFEDEILSVCWNILMSDLENMEAGLSHMASHDGTGHLAMFRGTPDSEEYQIAVLPEAAPTYALSNYEVSFYAMLHNGGNSNYTTSGRTLAVGIMTDPMDPSTFVQVGEPILPTNTYQQYTVNLSNYTGDGQYIAIKHFSTGNNAGYTLIDDVEVNALPCYVPDGLNATATAASASLGWHGDQSEYNVRYRTITVGEEAVTTTEDFSNYTAHNYNITSGGDRPSDWAYYTNNNTYVSPHVSSNDALSSNYAISGMNDQGNFLYMLMTTYAVMPRIENLTSFSFKFAFEGMTSEHGVFYMGYVTDATNITGTFHLLSNHSYQATPTLTTVTLTSEDINILNNTYGARIAFRFVCSKSYGFGIDDIVYTAYTTTYTYGEWENAFNQTSPLAISGLTPATNYQWQVQGIEEGCSDGEGNDDVTKWSKMATFTTLGCVKPIEAYTSNQDGWNLIASPIGTVSIEDVINLCSNTYDLYRFNQAAELEWENCKNTTEHPDFTTLVSGKGYLYANSQNVTLVFPNTPYNGTGTVDLEYSTDNPNENMHGWNLIGNPFATAATLDKPFFRMNEGGTGLSAQVEANSSVAAMEGVFVQATQTEQIATFTQVNNSKGGEKSEVPMININLSRNRGEAIANAIVRFDHGETLGTFSLHEDDSKIYITQDGKDYAVARSNGEGEIPVSFKAKENGTYTISVNAEGLEMNYLHLIDNMTGADVDLLATSSYTFTTKTTDYASRFKLVFSANDASTGSGTFAYISDGNIIITDADANATLQIMDVTGRVIVLRRGDVSGNISTAGMTPGVYVLRLINDDDVKTQKIVINNP